MCFLLLCCVYVTERYGMTSGADWYVSAAVLQTMRTSRTVLKVDACRQKKPSIRSPFVTIYSQTNCLNMVKSGALAGSQNFSIL